MNTQFSLFTAQSPVNYEQKLPCIIIADGSTSMLERNRINNLNAGLQALQQEILADEFLANRVELGVVRFANVAETILEPTLLEGVHIPQILADGATNLASGINAGLSLLQARHDYYRQTGQKAYKPCFFLISDGEPWPPGQDLSDTAREIVSGVDGNQFNFLSVSVDDGCNMDTLRQLSHPDTPPQSLNSACFGEFFEWITQTLGTVMHSRRSDPLPSAEDANWQGGADM